MFDDEVFANALLCTIEDETPELSITGNSMLYRRAAGDCAVLVRGRVLLKAFNGNIICMGFLMDLETPITVLTGPAPPLAPVLPPSRRRNIMYQMIRLVQCLHAKGIVHGDLKLENMLLDNQGKLRLFGFAQGRYMSEDEHVLERSFWGGGQMGKNPAPPTIEDDLYGLGLSIWHLYTGKMPHEGRAGDDMGPKERQRKGETAREIIRGLLRQGGARI
ncbi:kinase-like domain-containing protein [Corynascus novoguineensis]|uniref:Kinase-like domain-containing protein n=1 Tax=Corynascus novoguineensis TaxID=1126955 RepID=A0AAN7CVJ1_9PEZI|nr:kinase-like domain-containing protein [Corynascus novoguineensis]